MHGKVSSQSNSHMDMDDMDSYSGVDTADCDVDQEVQEIFLNQGAQRDWFSWKMVLHSS